MVWNGNTPLLWLPQAFFMDNERCHIALFIHWFFTSWSRANETGDDVSRCHQMNQQNAHINSIFGDGFKKPFDELVACVLVRCFVCITGCCHCNADTHARTHARTHTFDAINIDSRRGCDIDFVAETSLRYSKTCREWHSLRNKKKHGKRFRCLCRNGGRIAMASESNHNRLWRRPMSLVFLLIRACHWGWNHSIDVTTCKPVYGNYRNFNIWMAPSWQMDAGGNLRVPVFLSKHWSLFIQWWSFLWRVSIFTHLCPQLRLKSMHHLIIYLRISEIRLSFEGRQQRTFV